MSDTPERARVYGDKEVGLILKRAAEIQDREPAPGLRTRGFTLAELEEIASEAGISVDALRRAAEELDRGPARREPLTWATGEPVTIVLERTIPLEITDDVFEELVVEIQHLAGTHGQPSLLGRTLTWQADTPTKSRSLQILVTSRQGQTRIRIEERLHQLAGGLFGGLMGGLGGGLGIGVGLGVGIEVLGSVAFAVAWPLGVVGLSFMGARTIFSAVSRRRQRELGRLHERLVELVEERGVRPGEALRAPERPRALPEG
jgi:ribosomal protein L13E